MPSPLVSRSIAALPILVAGTLAMPTAAAFLDTTAAEPYLGPIGFAGAAGVGAGVGALLPSIAGAGAGRLAGASIGAAAGGAVSLAAYVGFSLLL